MKYYVKIQNILLSAIILSVAMSVSSCAESDLDWLVGTPIKLTASPVATTRSGSDIQTSSFEEGASINAYFNIHGGDAIGKTPTILTASAPDETTGKNNLSPDVQAYYPSSDNVDILALYPTTVTNTTTSFTVEADQQDEADYKKSDLMWAGVSNQAKTTSDVNLQFSHLMAKLSVTVTAKEEVLIKSVTLTNVIRTINITELSASQYQPGSLATVSDTELKKIILASTTATEVNNSLSGSVLFPPQTISGNFIEVLTDYGTAYYSLGESKTFEQGKAYSADLVVKRQDINFVTTITDWADNGGSLAVPPGSSAGLKIEHIADQAYDGTARTPSLNITYTPNDELNASLGAAHGTSYELVAGKDYTTEYFNNINQGTAIVIITGQISPDRTTAAQQVLANVISGIKSITSFNITAATGQITYPSHEKVVEYEYNTTVDDFPLDKHNGDGQFTYSSSDPTVADVTVSGIVTIKKVGTTRITANMDNSGNYSAASDYFDLTVTPRSIKNHSTGENPAITATLAATSFPYMDVAYSPAVVVKDNGRTLQENKHYTYSVVNNRNIGTATITIRGMGNYSDADADVITRTFQITAITPTITFDNTAVIVPKGQKYTRRAKTDYGTIRYSASPSGYVTISSDGVVTAENTAANHQPQKVTITATVDADATNHNWGTASKSYELTVVESKWEYVYSGGRIQTWECPVDGVYQLEAMGAQGATTGGFNGGRGADVAGQVFIKKGQKLFIYLGQAGTVQPVAAVGGWNGGGYYSGSQTADSDEKRFAGGGGATDFSLIKVTEANWATDAHLKSRILVAGGGGGALYCNTSVNSKTYIYCGGGGNGGGEAAEGRAEYAGEAGFGGSHPGGGGTLSAGGTVASGGSNGNPGSFGTGGNYAGTLSAGCGGGGWYGGASGATGTRQGAGGGGSSFIYNQDNLNAQTTTYNIQMPDVTSPASNFFVKTRAEANADPTKVWLEITPSNLVCGGSSDANGQARITYMSAE